MNHDQAYFHQDETIRSYIESSAYIITKEPDNEKYFRYWIDDDLKIRSCHECYTSQFKSKDDGEWIMYFSRDHLTWAIDRFEKGNYSLKCNLCEKCHEWRRNNYNIVDK